MEMFFESPELVNVIWITAAFIFGFGARQAGLPPMIGFLLSGFFLNYLGITNGSLALGVIADLGVLLLLFTIGLKLDLKSLLDPVCWAGATIHLTLSTCFFALIINGLGILGAVHFFEGMPMEEVLLVGFAAGFSSTVFAVKVLEARGEMNALHGRVAIGILIMQDILAVIFITISKGSWPSPWALLIPVFLFLIRPLLMYILDRLGHGELQSLGGLFVATALGATSFELVGLKPDLGALVIGALISHHPRSSELSRSLYSFKDLFLIGFFFSIGLTGIPEITHILIALLFLGLLVVKSVFFIVLLTRFKLRGRTSFLSSMVLSNYSEFGLICTSIACARGMLDSDWLIIMALALTFSFILSSFVNSRVHNLYNYFSKVLSHLETMSRHPGDLPIDLGDAEVLVFGMGRVGSGAYDAADQQYEGHVLGVDNNKETVSANQIMGRNVIWGDGADYDFWTEVPMGKVRLVMLTMPNHNANMFALQELKRAGFEGKVTATAVFDDQVAELKESGADVAYNVLSEAGSGFARHVCQTLGDSLGCKYRGDRETFPVL
ncbi:MAG: cation:proton antiporter [Desulfurivibrionaceae bacterium]